MFGKTISDLQTEASIKRLEEARQKLINPALSLSPEHRHLLEEHRRLNETGLFADIRRARERYEEQERRRAGFAPHVVREMQRMRDAAQRSSLTVSLSGESIVNQMKQLLEDKRALT